MHLEVSSLNDDNQPVVINFPNATATVADGSLIIVSLEGDELIGGFAPTMWFTFMVVDD